MIKVKQQRNFAALASHSVRKGCSWPSAHLEFTPFLPHQHLSLMLCFYFSLSREEIQVYLYVISYWKSTASHKILFVNPSGEVLRSEQHTVEFTALCMSQQSQCKVTMSVWTPVGPASTPHYTLTASACTALHSTQSCTLILQALVFFIVQGFSPFFYTLTSFYCILD